MVVHCYAQVSSTPCGASIRTTICLGDQCLDAGQPLRNGAPVTLRTWQGWDSGNFEFYLNMLKAQI